MRILFVENHKIFAEMVIAQFLSEHTLTLVPSLAEAWRAMDAGSFDAVLVDYDLDDGKGSTLIAELRKAGFGGRVIGVSSKEEGNQAMLEAGADAACGKLQFQRLPQLLKQPPRGAH